jgi:hypothetical protein
MLSIIFYYFAGSRSARSLHVESLYDECRYAGCHYAECLYAECLYAECLYAECLYDESRSVTAAATRWNDTHCSKSFKQKSNMIQSVSSKKNI